MNSIKIVANGAYLPKIKIDNEYFNKKFNLDEEWIYRRTGILCRYKTENESIIDLAINATKNMIKRYDVDISTVEAIIVATTSTQNFMPGISFYVQKYFNIQKCMCLDILGGCNGYINAFDIARNYIALGKINNALIIGVETISNFLNENDLNTVILLGDGAGATLIKKTKKEKLYMSNICSDPTESEILKVESGKKLFMDGKKIYKFAITKTVENIKELLKEKNESLENIKYIVPHQSNARILNKMASELQIDKEKMYSNLKEVGNTFCASIPIALTQMYDKNLLKEDDKIILIGYGGGLNWGSILLEI